MSSPCIRISPRVSGGLPDVAALVSVLLDDQGRVLWWSADATGVFGLDADDAAGQDVREVFPYGTDQVALTEALARAADGQVWTGLVGAGDAGGSPLICRFEPIAGPDGDHVLMTAARTATGAPFADYGGTLFNAATLIGSTLDLGQTARETVAVAVPGFADAAAVFVLERLFEGADAPGCEADGSVMVRRLAAAATGPDPDDWGAGLPGDGVVVNRATTPYARCVATAAPVLFDRLDSRTGEHLHDGTGFCAVPLRARGLVLGYAVFARTLVGFDDRDVALAQEIAARAAVCIDNARLYRLSRRTARALRDALLPAQPDAPPGLRVTHRYLPASGSTQVGGDWYDMIPLPGDRMALVIGDAMGHDTAAAAAMVQLRTAAHTLADLDMPPHEVLTRLDGMAQRLADAHLATCLFAVCDSAAGHADLACAGHVPPLLAHADGRTERVSLPSGMPLGVGGAQFGTRRVEVPDGSTLVLCTDGLVERRGHDIDAGIDALRRTLATPRRSLEATCEALMGTLDRRHDIDDVTLLLARFG